MTPSNSPRPQGKSPIPPAPALASNQSASAFGVAIEQRHKPVEAEGMSKKKKQIILAGALVVLSALVLVWQYWPAGAGEDPAVAAMPQIKPVVQAEQKKDVQALQQMVSNSDPIVASRAVTALAGLGQTDLLNQVEKDKRSEVRLAAVGAMSSSANESNLAALSRFMQTDPSADVRLRALSGVASVQSADAIEQLLPMLEDRDPLVRNAAIRAIEAKSGFRFADFDASRPGNPAVVARIRTQIHNARATLQSYYDQKKAEKR
jgi:flagellar basal body-associated protein FliL